MRRIGSYEAKTTFLASSTRWLEAARTCDVSINDAAYLDLAAARAIPLATIDGRLRAACSRAGVELVS